MTDFGDLTRLLDRWEVPYTVNHEGATVTVSVVQDGKSPRVTGYMAFFTDFEFTHDGGFIEMGAWE